MSNTLTITAAGDQEILISRAFDAPRPLVWEAVTRPELIKRWLGVHNGWVLDVCDMDFRVGGKYRYVWRGPNRAEMGMGGTYLEIERPERIVNTEQFGDPWYPGAGVGTMVLTERAGKTTMTTTVKYESKAARDTVLASPMESGMVAGYNALDAVLASLESPGGVR
jgi:uncharacterized protein YndB with AHSA1/START domain